MNSNAPILLAEDDENDVFLFRRAFDRSGLTNPLIAVKDGQQAVDYLTGTGSYADRSSHPLPGLLLLDLKMPRMSGFDVLAWLSLQPSLKGLAVVVLSSSAQESDIQKARQLGADEYQVKPSQYEQLVAMIRNLHDRWLDGVPKAE